MNAYIKCMLMLILLVVAGCGASGQSSSPDAAQTQSVDYFNAPVKVAALPATSTIQTSDVVITGVSRTTETITLNFNISVTNSDTVAQDITVTLSGRDRYGLEVLTPAIAGIIQPGETQIINQQISFTATLLFQVESWLVQSITPNIPQIVEPPSPEPVIPDTPTAPPTLPEQNPPIVTDTTGTINLLLLEPLEISRVDGRVNVATRFQFQNTSTTRANISYTLNGYTVDGVLVYTRLLSFAVDAQQTSTVVMSYGSVLAIPEYISIATWAVTDLVRD